MLIGQYHSKVNLKGRAAFPKKFREELGDRLVVTMGYEGSLIIVSSDGWKALIEGTENKPFIFGSARDTNRFLLGGATEVELDSQGRFVVPPYLREYGKLEEEVVFLGLNKYVEVWDKKHWQEYQKYLDEHIGEIAEKLGQIDLKTKDE
jgi:MraZ protein